MLRKSAIGLSVSTRDFLQISKTACKSLLTITRFGAAMIGLSTLGLGDTIIESYADYGESTYQDGLLNTIDLIASWLSQNHGSIIGPGTVYSGAKFNDTQSIFSAGSSGFLDVSPWTPWDYGQTQRAGDTILWETDYQIYGTPGDKLNLDLAYTFQNSCLTAAFDGRAECSSYFPIQWVGTDHAGVFFYGAEQYDLTYGRNDHFLALDWDGGQTQEGIIGLNHGVTLGPSGHVEFILRGELVATTEVQAYGPSVTISTMASTMTTDLIVQEIAQVPEPSTWVFLGSALIGIWAFRMSQAQTPR